MKTRIEQTIVVKVGGAQLEAPDAIDEVGEYLADLRHRQHRVVLVHGGGREIGALHEALDEAVVKLDGLRVTSERGASVNVNADTAAHAIATALAADSLGFVSDIPGVRVDEETGKVATRLRVADVAGLLSGSDVIRGGMVPKLRSAAEAVRAGVRRVRVGDPPGTSANRATELVA